jgi:hypothetical protein
VISPGSPVEAFQGMNARYLFEREKEIQDALFMSINAEIYP